MKIKIFIVLILGCPGLFSQNDSIHYIQVHFLYGSKPSRGYKKTEFNYFGGMHGGHVTVQVDSMDYGFEPAYGFHVFAHKKKFKSDFVDKPLVGLQRYADGNKVTTFIIPLNSQQYKEVKTLVGTYCTNTPYDYAFFGMRCAASARDILAQIGIMKKRSRFSTIITTFYPKKLRKRLFRLARKNNYVIIKQQGRESRKWEKD